MRGTAPQESNARDRKIAFVGAVFDRNRGSDINIRSDSVYDIWCHGSFFSSNARFENVTPPEKYRYIYASN
jgi:hypothetical protein